MRAILFLGLMLALTACTTTAPKPAPRHTFSSFDVPRGTNAVRDVAVGMVRWREADIAQVFEFYQDLSRRTVIATPNIPRNVKITFHNEQALNRIELLRLLDTVFAQQGIAMVYQGDDVVKAVPAGQAPQETPPEIDLPVDQIPDSSSYMQRTVKLRYLTGEEAQGIIAPFTKLPNSVIAVKGAKVLILRDYASNIRRMLSVLETVDTPAWKSQSTTSPVARSPRPATSSAR